MNHIELAHHYWKNHLQKKDLVIDCTCGNGKDTLFLARLLFAKKGTLYSLDIQKKAIENTKKLLEENNFSSSSFHLLLQSHENFDFLPQKASLFVYNLGYLPGSNKEIKTLAPTTLKSLDSALFHLSDRGAISITCYPGHKEGKEEFTRLLEKLTSLSSYHVCLHQWISSFSTAPCLFWIQKKI